MVMLFILLVSMMLIVASKVYGVKATISTFEQCGISAI